MDGRGVKGGTGARSPERSAGTGGGCRAKPLPLMPLEAIQPIGPGRNKAKPSGLPRSQSGKIGRGMQPKGLPKRSAERPRW